MGFHSVPKHNFFRDSVTFGNLLTFVIYREYITSLESLPRLNENDQHKFYMFLINMHKCDDLQVVQNLRKHEVLNETFSDLIIKKLQELHSIIHFVEYACDGSLDSILVDDRTELDTPDPFRIHPSSRVGLFLRKISLAFHSLTFERMVRFHADFFEFYDTVSGLEGNTSPPRPQPCPVSANEAFVFSIDLIRRVGQLGSLTPSELECITSTLEKHQTLYPQMPEPHLASHLLAIRQRNFSRAESELYITFELLIANQSPATQSILPPETSKPAEIWLHMTLAAVSMHYTFGHIQKARALQRQARIQALELNDAKFLRRVKTSHCIVNGMVEPLHYTALESSMQGTSSSEFDTSELHISLLHLLSQGATPQRVLLEYFNSFIAALSENFSSSLLELCLTLALYGYPVLENTLLQCAVMLDSLYPSRSSDDVLTKAICQIAHACATKGTSRDAVDIIDAAASTIGHLEQNSIFARTRVEIQTEQALHIGVDLNQCERLINTLELFAPWEASLRRVELFLKRGNPSEALTSLQRLIEISEHRRTSRVFGDAERAPLDDVDDARLDEDGPIENGVADIRSRSLNYSSRSPLALVYSEIRARLLLTDIFASNEMYAQALEEIIRTKDLASTYQLGGLTNVASLVECVLCQLCRRGSNARADVQDTITALYHQTPPALGLRLVNLAFWLAHHERETAGYKISAWMDHLSESAVFFGNTGNKYALQKTVDLWTALKEEGTRVAKDGLARHLFPLSY